MKTNSKQLPVPTTEWAVFWDAFKNRNGRRLHVPAIENMYNFFSELDSRCDQLGKYPPGGAKGKTKVLGVPVTRHTELGVLTTWDLLDIILYHADSMAKVVLLFTKLNLNIGSGDDGKLTMEFVGVDSIASDYLNSLLEKYIENYGHKDQVEEQLNSEPPAGIAEKNDKEKTKKKEDIVFDEEE